MTKYAFAAFLAISALFGLSANAASVSQPVSAIAASVKSDAVKVQHWRWGSGGGHWRFGSRGGGHWRFGSRGYYGHGRYGSRGYYHNRRRSHYRRGSRY